MEPGALRARLSSLIGFGVPEPSELVVHAGARRREGYTERAVSYEGGDGVVPVLLLQPDQPAGGAVVVHHQHVSQWYLGKSGGGAVRPSARVSRAGG